MRADHSVDITIATMWLHESGITYSAPTDVPTLDIEKRSRYPTAFEMRAVAWPRCDRSLHSVAVRYLRLVFECTIRHGSHVFTAYRSSRVTLAYLETISGLLVSRIGACLSVLTVSCNFSRLPACPLERSGTQVEDRNVHQDCSSYPIREYKDDLGRR